MFFVVVSNYVPVVLAQLDARVLSSCVFYFYIRQHSVGVEVEP